MPDVNEFHVLSAYLWDLRAQCEQKLRALTDAQRLLNEYPSTGAQRLIQGRLLPTLEEIVRLDTAALEHARACRSLAATFLGQPARSTEP